MFTNGCFDLLHAGHLQLLTQAARLGDRLVVAVDRDASVWRLKGPGRPVLDEKARTSLLGALDVVDAVVVFDDDLLDVIDHVGPDVIVKGADYRGREVVGASLVKSRGGRIELVPLLEGYSTTGLVERVRAGEGERPGAVGL
ncbi:MAG: adenylyltransferase/cytidyltransferase family protein [Microthrixaceae bacterium]|nr:adenylyltransferase/cytidyltransferase family protein [Microthrixaceae bacterium]